MTGCTRLVTGLLLLLGLLAGRPGLAAAQDTADWDLPGGHFYTQAGGDTPRPDDGFLAADRPGFGFATGRNFVRFWSELGRYGGVGVVGYPASRPFEWDGFDVQVFQKGIFQWRPEQGAEGRAWFMNVFDEFTRRGLDARLLAEQQVPLPGSFDDRGKSFEQIMAERLALLDSHPALLRQYWSVPDPVALYGLPTSNVQNFGPFSAVRLQRAGFQEWQVDVPGIARAGEVTVLNAGDLAKAYGLVPASAMQPVPPPAPASAQVVAYTPGRDESVSSPLTVSGKARAFEAALLWELTDAQHGEVLGRGSATAAACCEWSSFETEVPYAVASGLHASLAVWGASGRDAADRPGEVRIPLELRADGHPAAAKDGQRLIEPLRVSSVAGSPVAWLITARVRNESSGPISVGASEFGLRDEATGAVQWSDAGTTWDIGPGEAQEVTLSFAQAGTRAQPTDLRLLHRDGQSPAVVIDVPEPDTSGGSGTVTPSTDQPPPVQAAIADAARRTGLDAAAIQVLRAEEREWPNSGLGCPQPGIAYAQVLTPGWLVELRAGSRTLEYHTDARARAVLCAERPG